MHYAIGGLITAGLFFGSYKLAMAENKGFASLFGLAGIIGLLVTFG